MRKKGQMGPRTWLESENLAPGKQADLVLIKGDPFRGLRSGRVTNSRHDPGRVVGNPGEVVNLSGLKDLPQPELPAQCLIKLSGPPLKSR